MVYRLIFTIGSLFLTIILFISYYSRVNNKKLHNKIYNYLNIVTFYLLITEILTVIVFVYVKSTIVFNIALKLHWLSGYAYLYLFYMYSYLLRDNTKSNSLIEYIKSVKKLKIITIISIICVVIGLILPIDKMSPDSYDFIPGPSIYFALSYISILATSIFIDYLFDKKIDKQTRNSILIFLMFTVGLFVMQFIFSDISFYGLITSIGLFIFYFVRENPDLELIGEIDTLKQSIERSSRTKGDFLSNMSHEIRSPMNAIIGFSETILNDNGEYDAQKTLNDINHIKSSSKTLLDIINNILDLSKIETMSETLEYKQYAIKELIIDWTDIVKTRLEGKKIKFNLSVNNVPSKFYGDATKIFQIVLNLLTNSVKYTEVGRINMTITGTKFNDNYYTLSFKISDTGFGIKKEDFDKIFQKFSRLDSAKTNEIEGTGLGLALTKRYAELMGGKIWFKSDYGAGSTFYFDVNQKVMDYTLVNADDKDVFENNRKELLDCTGKRVLIVDDDELNLKVISRLLSGYKMDIVTLNNPEDCIFNFKNGEHYDLIFLDHIMRNMDGIEVMKIIKHLKGYYIPPVVVLTANALAGAREIYMKEGFDEYLSKPIDLNELDKIINMFLNK